LLFFGCGGCGALGCASAIGVRGTPWTGTDCTTGTVCAGWDISMAFSVYTR
jgi:hypothetical protein